MSPTAGVVENMRTISYANIWSVGVDISETDVNPRQTDYRIHKHPTPSAGAQAILSLGLGRIPLWSSHLWHH